jgi:histidyl-tRNA synthetase
MPEVNGGQTSDLVQKIVKEFMSNLDFDGRMKRSERELLEMRKKHDTFTELEKKIYALSKEIDMSAITKELKKKCDEENTRKDNRILDSKIEQLFEFYKQLRREVEEKRKVVSKNEPFESASLTTKRLMSANCISCTPSTPQTRRPLNRSRMDMSLDYSIEGQKNTMYSRMGK